MINTLTVNRNFEVEMYAYFYLWEGCNYTLWIYCWLSAWVAQIMMNCHVVTVHCTWVGLCAKVDQIHIAQYSVGVCIIWGLVLEATSLLAATSTRSCSLTWSRSCSSTPTSPFSNMTTPVHIRHDWPKRTWRPKVWMSYPGQPILRIWIRLNTCGTISVVRWPIGFLSRQIGSSWSRHYSKSGLGFRRTPSDT